MGDFLAVYEQALSCYKKGALDKAWQLIEDFEQKQGMRVSGNRMAACENPCGVFVG